MPIWWWVLFALFGFVAWGCAVLAVIIAVGEFFFALERRRRRRARGATDVLFTTRQETR